MKCERCKKREAEYLSRPTNYGKLKIDGVCEKKVCENCKNELVELLPGCHTFYKL